MALAPASLPHVGLVLGPGYSLTAAQGSYSVSGQSAGLVPAYLVSAAQGSYSVSGQDAVLGLVSMAPGPFPHLGLLGGLGNGGLTQYSILADQGSYAVAGQTAGLLSAYVVAAQTSTYSVVGQPAIFNLGLGSVRDPGPFPHIGMLLTGVAAASYTLTADPGIYNVVGSDGLIDVEVSAAQGTYTISGQDAALKGAFILTADRGTYSISGQDVAFTVTGNRILTADQGAYSVSGQDQGLYRGYPISADQGFYALLGQEILLTYGVTQQYTMAADFGTYIHNGLDVLFDVSDPVLQCDVGYYEVVGYEAFQIKKRKDAGRKRKKYLEHDDEIYEVASQEEAELLLSAFKEQAQEAIQRAVKAEKRPTRKILQDARKSLDPPEIHGPPEVVKAARDEINEIYQDALRTIEIAARMRKTEDEEDEILLALL